MKGTRVLSIQSHVVYGYVGNKAAIFPLQLLGFDTDALNTAQFSNHTGKSPSDEWHATVDDGMRADDGLVVTGYPTWGGQLLESAKLRDIFDGLMANELADYAYVLTGYIGSSDILDHIVTMVRTLKTRDTSTVYVCDPVMGDEGRLYVAPELVRLIGDRLAPLADIITPNRFELE